jgi:hypothetical protein
MDIAKRMILFWTISCMSMAHMFAEARDENKPVKSAAWEPKIGLKVGSANLGVALSLFFESPPANNKNIALRTGIEMTRGKEETSYGGRGPFDSPKFIESRTFGPMWWAPVTVKHQGVFVDGIYYLHGYFRYYAFAGAGFYQTTVAGTGNVYSPNESLTKTSLTVSAGTGMYFNNYFGLELKFARSFVSYPYPREVGEEWYSVSLLVRFPLKR